MSLLDSLLSGDAQSAQDTGLLAKLARPSEEMRSYSPPLRQRVLDYLVGDTRPSQAKSSFLQGLMGLSDWTPMGAAYGLDEMQRSLRAGDQQGAQLAALAAIPGFKPAQKVAQKVASGPGIRAYHGSPHDFDRFDISKIGTGEGAQTYGHGLYFAENENVARSYRDALSKGSTGNKELDDLILSHQYRGGTIDDVVALIRNQTTDPNKRNADRYSKMLPLAEEVQRTGFPAPGKMYEVNINARPEQFLDWDKPLRDQPVSETVRSLVPPDLRKSFDYNVDKGNIPGSNAYMNYVPTQSFPIRDTITSPWRGSGAKSYEEALGLVGGDANRVNRMLTPNASATSQNLLEAGIPGIRYLDQGSRSTGQGTNNYVLFNDTLVDILRKYGLAGATVGTGAATQIPQAQDVY